jgi:hypothetical protein
LLLLENQFFREVMKVPALGCAFDFSAKVFYELFLKVAEEVRIGWRQERRLLDI